jgi:hypothetical protein
MAVVMHQRSPVAPLPLVLGVVRQLQVAALLDTCCPPHPAHVLSCGRGVEALLLAMLDGQHALSKVGARLEERGMVPLLQPGLTSTALNDYRLGQILAALGSANLNRVFGAVALQALEIYALPTPWLHQDTTPITLSGAYEAGEPTRTQHSHSPARPGPPRPAYGPSTDGQAERKQVLPSRGVSHAGLPLRLGGRAGNTRDSLSRWNRACAGASIPPPSARYGWRNRNGWRHWPCSPSWAYSSMQSSHGKSDALSALMIGTSPAIKARRPRLQRPWSVPSLRQ